MPGDYRNSLGYLGLQLRAGQLAQDQARQAQVEQQGREAAQSDVQNTLAFMKQHEAAKSASEDRKLQLAAMLQKAQEDRALREALGNQSNATKVRGQDLTNEDRDKAFDQKLVEFADKQKQQQKEFEQRAYGLLSQRLGVVNAPNTVTGDRPFQLGSELLRPPPGSMENVSAAPESETPAPQPGAAPPSQAGPVPGVTPTPPNAPDETGMSRKQREEALAKASTDAQALKDLQQVVAALHDPKQADPSDFGAQGSRFSIAGVSPNTIGDILETKGSARRTALGQKINTPLNAFMRKYGAALTETELGRALGEAGLQKALSGEFDLFAAPLPIVQSSFKSTLERLAESAAKTSEELRTNKRKLPDILAPATTRRGGETGQTAKIDLEDPKAFYAKDLAAAKERIRAGKLDRAKAEELFRQHYGADFNPADLD